MSFNELSMHAVSTLVSVVDLTIYCDPWRGYICIIFINICAMMDEKDMHYCGHIELQQRGLSLNPSCIHGDFPTDASSPQETQPRA